MFTQLKSELYIHVRSRKHSLSSTGKGEETPRSRLIYEEHKVVKRLLSELESEPKDAEEWTAKFTVLKENVEHHVEEEEGEMFKKARRVLSQEEIDELGTRLEEAKGKQKAAGAR